jgi:GNAT superfamily N-acetyltransferase
MEHITFDNTYHPGIVVFENDLYIHVHHPEMLLAYDNNFLKFKRTPTLFEFMEAEYYLRTFHLKHDQKHVKFYFSQNQQIPDELMAYLLQSQHQIGLLELYSIHPNQFPTVTEKHEITIQPVTIENIEIYLKLQYEQDQRFGHDYAVQKQGQYKRNFDDENYLQVMAYHNHLPAGSLNVIISQDTAEIDGFTVIESFQKKGIGSMLQRYVMDQFHDKTIILVANGHDTAREMYRRQNYQYQGFRYEVMKVYE